MIVEEYTYPAKDLMSWRFLNENRVHIFRSLTLEITEIWIESIDRAYPLAIIKPGDWEFRSFNESFKNKNYNFKFIKILKDIEIFEKFGIDKL